ncbi:MAG: DUF1800 domain-containing protein [Chitinophagaceae bacterium]|jgi:uncharacterized protein (DUF1800 family)|nr:DUF1800 domain-containing protein [Chitinophagaceae bacterium]OQY93427.1 MAG: hypothetical protein B6D37_11475 [Sphingobacteriales bacterium UTBCD1]
MSQGNFVKNKHLLWRAGFGPGVEQLGDLSEFSHKEFYKAMVKASRKDPVPLSEAQGTIQGLFMGVSDLGKLQLSELNADQRKLFQAKLREGVRNLNLAWMREMVNSSAQMREKISLFWHGHFACRNLNVFYQQGLVNVIRDNALGNFRDLLHSVSKTAAMLNFLNNQQNKKDHPNENFAREVMELFTLGRGNYTERDIKESARAFTGWTANFQGDFIFRKGQHDTGVKTFLGKTGNFDGDEILDIILEQKQAARFISRKIYKFYVNENDTDPEKAEWLADRFYKSDYDISKLMEDIFTSEWFYDEKNMGINIKSPVELLVGIQRMLPMELENEEVLIVLQRILDQMLFYPPNVAGWPGGRTWIDSSSLMMRMRIPQLINNTDELNVKPKDDDDVMMGRKDTEVSSLKKKKMTGIPKKQQINASVNWGVFLKYFEKTGRDNLIGGISKLLLQTKGEVSDDTIREYADESSRESFIKTAAIQIMSTPEYQLC